MGRTGIYRRKGKSQQLKQLGSGKPDQPSVKAERAHNVVDALYSHFKKWKPEVLKNSRGDSNASSI